MIATWHLACGLAALMRTTTAASAAGAASAATATRHCVGRTAFSLAERSEERKSPARMHTFALLALNRIIRLAH
jgi:hypothetical protein